MSKDEERISDTGIVIEKFMETWGEDCYPKISIPRQFENFGCVTLGGKFCNLLSNSLERGFNVIQLKAAFFIKATNVGRELISIMNSPFVLLREELPDHRFSPENELLLDVFAEFECDMGVLGRKFESLEEAEQVARILNDLIDAIREKLSSTAFVKARDASRRACQKT